MSVTTMAVNIPDLESYSGKRVLVTGALGFLGASVIDALSGADCEVSLIHI